MKLSVVIVSYNVRHYLVQCLESVARAIEGIDGDVWVVDNNSSDDSVAAVRSLFPDVHVIVNNANVGFSRANNQAISQATGDFILLLNPDTIVGRQAFTDALALMEREPQAGALGVKMLNRDGSFAKESRRGLPTPLTAFYKMSGLCALFPRSRRFGKYYMQYLDPRQATKIEVISGAFMLLRRKMLDQVGLLDEDYFMYGEDIDISYRCMKGGWDNWYVPTTILHYKGESSRTNSMGYVLTFYNAMLIFINKHFRQSYRGMTWLVKVAVYCHGVIVMLSKYLRRMLLSLHTCVASLLHISSKARLPREGLMFIGSDEAWVELQALCQRANLVAHRCATLDEVAADRHTPKAIYIALETDTDADCYTRVLTTLREAYSRRLDLNIGTYSLKHKVLLLPNDCFV